MKPDIDSIIEELRTDTPDLTVEDGVLRAVLLELIAKQPAVAIDEAFRVRLRAELMKGEAAPAEKRFALPWWFAYTVPVGLTALLLLVIQPPYATAPVVSPNIETTETTEQSEALEATETGSAPTTGTDSFDAAPAMLEATPAPAPAMKVGGGDDSARMFDAGMAEDGAPMMVPESVPAYFTAAFTSDRQTLLVTYLSLEVPAFLMVTGPDEVVAVSGLFLPGEHVNVVLPITGRIESGVLYGALLYYDNGDGVYTKGAETLARDRSGVPISLELVAP
jgi:hypothetical protein